MKRTDVYYSLRRAGLRITGLKRDVVELFLSGGCCLSAEEVYDSVPGDYHRSSVYRCLQSLVEAGFLRLGTGKRGVVEYRCGRSYLPDHGHFHCLECGAVIPVADRVAAGMIEAVEKEFGVHVDTMDFTMEGKCENCS